ncbi:MAG: sulfate ABC transporter substrate-binding protein [Verrucomicrobiota bacterium]
MAHLLTALTHLPQLRHLSALALCSALFLSGCKNDDTHAASKITLLNVSYDPTREFYNDYNKAFTAHWLKESNQELEVRQSHGGSGKQARAVIDGLAADVVTLALALDIDAIAERSKLIPPDWTSKLPHNSAPYTSTIVFLVRKGNPKGIKDWGDLVKPGIQVITPNPKTGGGARWNYLAAWAWAEAEFKGDEEKIRTYIRDLLKTVPVWDSGARGSTTTFAQREIGDVLLTWENEAFLAQKEFGADKFDLITPSLSILAQPPVAVVETNAKKNGTEQVAHEYLAYLFSPQGQHLAAQHFFRPVSPEHAAPEDLARFKEIKTVTIESAFGGWSKAQEKHFADGGTFDQLKGN